MKKFSVTIAIICCVFFVFPCETFAAPAQKNSADIAKGLLAAFDALETISDVATFKKEFGEPSRVTNENPEPGESVSYEWTIETDVKNAFMGVSVEAVNGKVISRSLENYATDAEGSHDYESAQIIYIGACRGFEALTKYASKITESEDDWGYYYAAYYPLPDGRLLRAGLTLGSGFYGFRRAIFKKIAKGEEDRYMIVKGNNVNVREQPSTKSNVVGQVSKDEPYFQVSEKKQNKGEKFPWYYFSNQMFYGWIYGEFVAPTQLPQYTLADLASQFGVK
jgi:hypothetical protein